MVHVVLAGGTGNVAREILEVLREGGKHQLTVFTRVKEIDPLPEDVSIVKVNYYDHNALATALEGVDVVLSFIGEAASQKALIDAAVSAGVKRFAPNEWALGSNSREPGAGYKDEVFAYLRTVNQPEKVLEYTLFQTGGFLDLVVWPRKTAKHLHTTCIGIDVDNQRALIVEDGRQQLSFTTIRDVARMVAAAIDYEGDWPEVGGIAGESLLYKDLLEKLEHHSGKRLQRYVLRVEDLKQGRFDCPWTPPWRHPMIPEFLGDYMARKVLAQWWLVGAVGDSSVNEAWNKLLPEIKLIGIDEFLQSVYGSSQ